MLVALLASVSAGIFAAHILDAFRTGQHAIDAWAVTFGLGPGCAEIQTITTDAIANAGTFAIAVRFKFRIPTVACQRPLCAAKSGHSTRACNHLRGPSFAKFSRAGSS
jgi:hypothetical protein